LLELASRSLFFSLLPRNRACKILAEKQVDFPKFDTCPWLGLILPPNESEGGARAGSWQQPAVPTRRAHFHQVTTWFPCAKLYRLPHSRFSQPNTATERMCGIHLAISSAESYAIPDELRSRLVNRGPDFLGHAHFHVDQPAVPGAGVSVHLSSSVLALRGDHITKQPFVSPGGQPKAIFSWNGEAWKIGTRAVQGNDGEAIFRRLQTAGGYEGILQELRAIEGPFTFVYADLGSRQIFFGRDRLGRRSLLISDNDGFELSSASYGSGKTWKEVEADGIYTLDLDAYLRSTSDGSSRPVVARHDWVLKADRELVSPRSLVLRLPVRPTTHLRRYPALAYSTRVCL
jgi:hypothetical protein